MNPQPPEYVGNIFATLFVAVTVFHAVKAYLEGKVINLKDFDTITLGYLESHPYNNIIVVDKPKTKNVNIKQEIESHQLYIDCIDTLVALGMKKMEAKKKTKHIFETAKPQPKTVQEFLNIALKRDL